MKIHASWLELEANIYTLVKRNGYDILQTRTTDHVIILTAHIASYMT